MKWIELTDIFGNKAFFNVDGIIEVKEKIFRNEKETEIYTIDGGTEVVKESYEYVRNVILTGQ